ncbi:hypothetical protein FGO68_gene8150 [Halteria grandinella]|uniref:Uncharacterized protein n=1 Tax=Halteria grandinella TaxID=5974 RepID=A0A8J8T9V4_HALGN|nr:hypothetical protein FGO68_gene8150 [Halteria grandinella]
MRGASSTLQPHSPFRRTQIITSSTIKWTSGATSERSVTPRKNESSGVANVFKNAFPSNRALQNHSRNQTQHVLNAPFGTVQQYTNPDPVKQHRPTKSNLSQFRNGFELELEFRPSKQINNQVSNKSQIKFDPLTPQEREAFNQQRPTRSKSPNSQYSRDMRDPILGVIMKDMGQGPIVDMPQTFTTMPSKKIIEFKPSDQLVTAEFKPMSELYSGCQSKKTEMNLKRNQSNIPFSNPTASTQDFSDTHSVRTPQKKVFNKSSAQEMGSILGYKDALPFRDTQHGASKVNQTSNQAVVKYTMQKQIQLRKENTAGAKSMSKSKEMKSDIGF